MRVKSAVHVNDLSIALHCLLDLITNINVSKISPDLDLGFSETRAEKTAVLCWITKQLRENIREMKFWNFSRDSWLFNVVSHFLFLAGIKSREKQFLLSPDLIELLIDFNSAPKISRRLLIHNKREKITSFKAAIVYWMIAWWLVNSRVLGSSSEFETRFWWPGLRSGSKFINFSWDWDLSATLHAPLENHK